MIIKKESLQQTLKSNSHRQSQTKGTAFRLPSLLNGIGFCAENRDNCHAYAIIDGTYILFNNIDSFSKEFIATLARRDSTQGCFDCIKHVIVAILVLMYFKVV